MVLSHANTPPAARFPRNAHNIIHALFTQFLGGLSISSTEKNEGLASSVSGHSRERVKFEKAETGKEDASMDWEGQETC